MNLLVELFVEELPPKALKKLGEAFAAGLAAGFAALAYIPHRWLRFAGGLLILLTAWTQLDAAVAGLGVAEGRYQDALPLLRRAQEVKPRDDVARYLEQVERDIILRALAQTQFNRTQAAQLLGISFRQLRYQMQKLDIHAPEA